MDPDKREEIKQTAGVRPLKRTLTKVVETIAEPIAILQPKRKLAVVTNETANSLYATPLVSPVASEMSESLLVPIGEGVRIPKAHFGSSEDVSIGKSFAGLATAKLAAKQFKKGIQKTPLMTKVESLLKKTETDEIIRRARINKLTGWLFNEDTDQIPKVFLPAIEKTAIALEAVNETIETHKPLVEVLVYWENFAYVLLTNVIHIYRSSLLITTTILFTSILARYGFHFVYIFIVIYFANSAFKRYTLPIQHQLSNRNQHRLRKKIKHELKKMQALKMMDNDDETCEWLNTILTKYWAQYEAGLSETISISINDALEVNKPTFLDDLRLSEFTLGSEAPRIESVKTYPRSRDDILMMDFEVAFEPFDDEDQTKKSKLFSNKRNSKIELVARIGKGVASIPIPVLLTEVAFRGTLRVQMKFCTTFPHIEVVELTFLERPMVDFILRPLKGLDLMDTPGLSSFLKDTINWGLDTNIVDPVTVKIPVLEMMGSPVGDPIVGILLVNVLEGRNLRNVEIAGKSDPYLKIMLGDNEVSRSKTITANLSPFWGEQKYVIIYKSMTLQTTMNADTLYYEVFDYNKLGKDKSMGMTATLSLMKYTSLFNSDELSTEDDVEKIVNEWGAPHNDVWTKLYTPDAKHAGDVRTSIAYFPTPTVPLQDRNSGILQITIYRAKDLAVQAKASTFLQIELNNVMEARTPTKKRTNTPVWEYVYTVYLPDLESARVKFTLKEEKDVGVSTTLGSTSLNIRSVLSNPVDWYPLLGGAKQGKLRISFKCTFMDLQDTGHSNDMDPIGIAKIVIKGGKSLMNVEIISKSDPYAVVTVEGRKIGRTHHLENTLDPIWNDTFYAVIYTKAARLKLEVFDYNKIQADKKLGRCELYFDEILKGDGFEAEEDSERLEIVAGYERDGLMINRDNTSADVTAPLYLFPENYEKDGKKKIPKQKGHIEYSIEIFSVVEESIIKAYRHAKKEILVNGVVTTPLVHSPSDAERDIDNIQILNLHTSGIIKFKVHEVKGIKNQNNIYVEFGLDDELEPALQTTIINNQNDFVWDESCDVFLKDVHIKRFYLSVHESADGVQRNEDSFGELGGMVPTDYIGKGNFWVALPGGVEVRVSCSYSPIDLVMEDSEKSGSTGLLHLTLVNATDLEGVDSGGTSDPYCVVLINSIRAAKTKTIKKTTSPVFNEEFHIPIKHRQRTNVQIQIFDYNALSKDVLLGTVSFPLSKIAAGELMEGSYPVEGAPQGKLNIQLMFEAVSSKRISQAIGSRNASVALLSMERSGSMMPLAEKSVTILPVERNPSMYNRSQSGLLLDDDNDLADERNAAKSLFSAEDLSKPVITGTVKVTIVAAKGLKSVDSNGLSDPYIKVIQNYRGKIKTIYRTAVLKKTLAPVFKNESFEIKVPPSLIRFCLKDKNAFQESKSLGEVDWDVAQYCYDTDQMSAGTHNFDIWLPVGLGGTGRLNICGSIIVGVSDDTNRSRKSSISSVVEGIKRVTSTSQK